MLWLRRIAPGETGGLSTGEATSGDAIVGEGEWAEEATGRGLQGQRRGLTGGPCSGSAPRWPVRRSERRTRGNVRT